MAISLKTVKYAFPVLPSLVNNTLTNMTQITLNLPENTKVFRSVVANITMDDIITATGGTLTTKTFNLRLGAAAYTSIANANALTNSGENASFWFSNDYTTHFTTNWTGAAMTCDFQLQVNQSTGTTLGMVNVCVELVITYQYDDASASHIKTVMIPLNAPVGALATAAATVDTIPVLDTYLPEASKVYRNIYVVLQGNESRNALTTDHTITINVGAATITTGNYEGALASDRMFRYVWQLTATYPSTSATQNFQLSATVARCNHLQAYLVVTYEFNPTTTTSVMNAVMLPVDAHSPMGGTAVSDAQRADRELFIQEPGTITTNRVAFFAFWTQIAAVGGLNMRIGTGAFVAYTDTASVLCGSNAAMIRNDAAVALVRGRNNLIFDSYRTDTADFGWNLCGFWLVNYTSGKATQGVSAHNHSVELGLAQHGTTATANTFRTAAVAPVIPETNYYITASGTQLITMMNATATPAGVCVQTERLPGEGGVKWEECYIDITQTDPEVGYVFGYSQIKDLFDRWPNDPDSTRMDMEVARRWQVYLPGANGATPCWVSLNLIFTYHAITYSVTGNITNSGGGTVTINACRATTGERILTTSRVGNGSYSMTWYDNTENIYVEARESATLLGRSDNGLAA